jgi:hypothetical protein
VVLSPLVLDNRALNSMTFQFFSSISLLRMKAISNIPYNAERNWGLYVISEHGKEN